MVSSLQVYFPTKLFYTFLISAISTIRPAPVTTFDLIIPVFFEEYELSNSLCFSPVSCYFCPLRSIYCLHYFVLRHS
jgi:hypothetical protein